MLMCGAGILTFSKAYCSSRHIGEVLFLLLRVASRSEMDGNLGAFKKNNKLNILELEIYRKSVKVQRMPADLISSLVYYQHLTLV